MRTLRSLLVVVVGLGLLAAACGSGGETKAQATAKITANWESFFDPAIPLSKKPALLENGTKLKSVLDAQSQNPIAKSLKAKVTKVVVNGNSAAVTYNLNNTANGQTLLNGSQGTAVKQGGTWLVSQSTFCGLVGAGGGHC